MFWLLAYIFKLKFFTSRLSNNQLLISDNKDFSFNSLQSNQLNHSHFCLFQMFEIELINGPIEES